MTAVAKSAFGAGLLDARSKRVVVGDGAMGTQLQAADLSPDDFNHPEGSGSDTVETKYVRLQSG